MDARGVEAKERVPASRKLGRAEAVELAKKARRVVVARGAKVRVFEPRGKPDDETIEAMLGATGNLRAPTIVAGDTVLVGFSEDAYASSLK